MKRLLVVIGTVLAASLGTVSAGVVCVTSLGDLGANDAIDWGQLGGTGKSVPAPSAVVSTLGVNATISDGFLADLQRQDQGDGYYGTFAPGTRVLYSAAAGPLILSFSSPVKGVGFEIQQAASGSFLGSIQAYDASDHRIGMTYTESGYTDPWRVSPPPIFIGLLSSDYDIYKVVFGTTGTDNQNFAVGRVALVTAPVPEASSLVSGFLTLMGVAVFLVRRRVAKTA